MHASDNLYRLIHSMTQGERRQFRLQSKFQTGKKAYLKLYQMLRRKQTMDDQQVMKTLGMESKPQAYYNLKNYLFRYLLKSLIHSCETPEGEIGKKIMFAKILIKKGIYAQAQKIILPLLAQVRAEERFLYFLELSHLYRLVQLKGGQSQDWEKLKPYRKEGILLMNNWQKYETLFEDFQPYLTTFSTFFGKDILFKMINARENPLFQDVNRALSVRSKRCYWGLRYVSAMMDCDFQGALGHCHELLKLFKDHPFLQTDHFPEYATVLINSGRLQLILGKTKECEITLAKAKSLADAENSVLIRLQVWTLEMNYAIYIGNKPKGMEKIIEIEHELDRNPESMESEVLLPTLFGVAYGYLALGEPKKAMKNATKLDRKLGSAGRIGNNWVRHHLRWATRLLNLMIAFDMDDGELLHWYYRSAYRFLYCRGMMDGFCGQFIRALDFVTRQPLLERVNAYGSEIEKLEKLLESPLERKTLVYFDAITWLRGKQVGKTIVEINLEG